MTVTIALQSAIVFSVNLSDAIMLARYSENALSGVALVNQVQFLLQMLVFGTAEGALIFSSRSWGNGGSNRSAASPRSRSNSPWRSRC